MQPHDLTEDELPAAPSAQYSTRDLVVIALGKIDNVAVDVREIRSDISDLKRRVHALETKEAKREAAADAVSAEKAHRWYMRGKVWGVVGATLTISATLSLAIASFLSIPHH